MEMALGEHGGSGDMQGFDQEGKEVEWDGGWKKVELEILT